MQNIKKKQNKNKTRAEIVRFSALLVALYPANQVGLEIKNHDFRFAQARYETMSESKNETVTICHQLKKLAQICPC